MYKPGCHNKKNIYYFLKTGYCEFLIYCLPVLLLIVLHVKLAVSHLVPVAARVLHGWEVQSCYVSSIWKRHCLIALLKIAWPEGGVRKIGLPLPIESPPWPLHSTWHHGYLHFALIHKSTRADCRKTHMIDHWHHCGNNRGDPNLQDRKNAKLSPISLLRLPYCCPPDDMVLEVDHL